MEIDVVLPCLNEAGALPWVLSRMPNGFRPIVADNGSTDESAAIAAAYGARVVHVPQRGFGAACHAGLLAASSDIVCVMDADASFDPGDLPLVADPVIAGAADLMLGRRATQGKGAWPLHARIGNRVLAAELRRRVGVPVRDLGPMRAARREDLLALDLKTGGSAIRWRWWCARPRPAGGSPRRPCRTTRGKASRRSPARVRGTARTVKDMRRVLASIAPAPARHRARHRQAPAQAPARPGPGPGARAHRAGHVVTADVYTGKHRREGALGAPGPRRPGCPGPPAASPGSRPRASPPGARRAACWRRRSW